MPEYRIREGDCIASIAQQHGFFLDTIWDHPNNAELKTGRQDPNVLLPGDVVFVPEREEKQESGDTEQRHCFRVKGVPAKVRFRILAGEEPRVNDSYILEIDGELFSGTTNANGELEHPIPPDARSCRLLVGEDREEYLLDLGHLDPIDEIKGVQGRLNNLGFDCGEIDGVLGSRTEAALREFQRTYELTESGQADSQTKAKLEEVHGL